MKYLNEHNILASFYFWFDHTLLREGEAFQNISSQLYSTTGGAGFQFGTPYKQWVYDSSIPNAQIPSGAYVNNNFVPRGGSGLKLDFFNAQLNFTTSPPTNEVVSGDFAIKDFDLHVTDESEEVLLFQTKYLPKQPINQQIEGKILESHEKVYPSVFLKYNVGDNESYQLGLANGKVTSNVRAIVLADNIYLFDGITSLFRDKRNNCFYILQPEEMPLDAYSDLKSGSYNYLNTVDAIANKPSKTVYIKNVSISKFSEKVNVDIEKGVIAGIIDFDLELFK